MVVESRLQVCWVSELLAQAYHWFQVKDRVMPPVRHKDDIARPAKKEECSDIMNQRAHSCQSA